MIPPRLRAILVAVAISDYTIDQGPKKGKRVVTDRGGELHTANYRATDLLKLEKKGLIAFSKLDHMSAMWGCPWFKVIVTEAGKEEIADEFARRCAEADEANARLEAPPNFGEGFVEDVDEERAIKDQKAEARKEQRVDAAALLSRGRIRTP